MAYLFNINCIVHAYIMKKIKSKVTKKQKSKPISKQRLSLLGLNRSVSTYGKNNLRCISNDVSWLQIQEKPPNNKGLFSDSEDSKGNDSSISNKPSLRSSSNLKTKCEKKRPLRKTNKSPSLSATALVCEKEKPASLQSPEGFEPSPKHTTTEDISCNVINSSVAIPWLALNTSKAKHINRARRRCVNDYKITDGKASVSIIHAFAEASASIESFQTSFICGHTSSHFNASDTSVAHERDGTSEPRLVQSTPVQRRTSPVLTIPLSVIRTNLGVRSFNNQLLDTPLVARQQKFKRNKAESSLAAESSFCHVPLISTLEDVCLHNNKSVTTCAPTSKEKVLQECNQSESLPFEAIFSSMKNDCQKLGEGVYAEVFRLTTVEERVVAIKVIPIEGQDIINGEKQKSFAEILPEIVSSSELSQLTYKCQHCTDCFIKLFRAQVTRGMYPSRLLAAWDDYAKDHTSENDRPDLFCDEQLYVVFMFDDGGADMEHFTFRNASQALSTMKQIIAGLAIAEDALQFEHRDLHWGNILVQDCAAEESVQCFIDGDDYNIDSCGVRIRIIDFTLSRMTKGGLTLFQDLASDVSLFTADADVDYQFEIYRMMREETGNDWSQFRPKTNVFWIHYLLDKFLHHVKYKYKRSKIHMRSLKTLQQLYKSVLDFTSCHDMFQNSSLFKT